MELETRDTVLRLTGVVALVLGLGFIFGGGPALTTAGIVLVIVSAIVFIAVVRDFFVLRERAEGQ